MPAKPLTKAQFEALGRIEGTNDGVNHVNYFVYKSLADRRYFTSASDGSWALTQRAKDAVYAYMQANPGAVYAAHTLTPQQIAFYQGNPNAQGETGIIGEPDPGAVGVIVEPDHSDDDTEPIEPIKTTFELYGKPEDVPEYPLSFLDDTDPDERAIWDMIEKSRTRHDYKLAYRTERLLQRLGDHGSWVGIEDANTEYVSIDLCIAAHESLVARSKPDPEPFMCRYWSKRMDGILEAFPDAKWRPTKFAELICDFGVARATYFVWRARLVPDEIPF